MKHKAPATSVVIVVCNTVLLTLQALLATEPFSESGTFLVDTRQARVDTDGDGMPDAWEIAYGFEPLRDNATEDADGDGESNLHEYNAGTDPLASDDSSLSQSVSAPFTVSTHTVPLDRDRDGLPDAWETVFGGDPARSDAGEDPDGDGSTNLEEYNNGTNPQSKDLKGSNGGVSQSFVVNTSTFPFSLTLDTDGDGMPDWWEIRYGLAPTTNDSSGDLDSDGVSNLSEFQRGENPSLRGSEVEVSSVSALFVLSTRPPRLDSDLDGIPDSWEISHGLNPLQSDMSMDTDGDSATNLEEYNAGTDPLVNDSPGPAALASSAFLVDTGGLVESRIRDTDGDGMPDWWEVRYGLDPRVVDSFGDLDGDGSTNLEEYIQGANPRLPDRLSVAGVSFVFLLDTGGRSFDSDRDGISDWWERLHFGRADSVDPKGDSDADGQTNYAEFITDTDPLDPSSLFSILNQQVTVEAGEPQLVIVWTSSPGATYSIWRSGSAKGAFEPLATAIPSTPPLNVFRVRIDGAAAFFRIQLTRGPLPR